jgi:hypothetical protein
MPEPGQESKIVSDGGEFDRRRATAEAPRSESWIGAQTGDYLNSRFSESETVPFAATWKNGQDAHATYLCHKVAFAKSGNSDFSALLRLCVSLFLF